jgi:type II secretory pathway pseudopilin PulG
MALMLESKLLRARSRNRRLLAPGRWNGCRVNIRIPASLKFTVPLILLGFVAALAAVNLLYHVPQAEKAEEEDSRNRLAQEMSRLQSTLEYLLLKGDLAWRSTRSRCWRTTTTLALAALTDDKNVVIASTRRAWLGGRSPMRCRSSTWRAADAIRERRAEVNPDATGDTLLGYTGVLIGSERRSCGRRARGTLILAYDLDRYKAEARARVLRQSLYWSGWVTALALAMWLVSTSCSRGAPRGWSTRRRASRPAISARAAASRGPTSSAASAARSTTWRSRWLRRRRGCRRTSPTGSRAGGVADFGRELSGDLRCGRGRDLRP